MSTAEFVSLDTDKNSFIDLKELDALAIGSITWYSDTLWNYQTLLDATTDPSLRAKIQVQ